MTTTPELFKAWKLANDKKIEDLEKDIKEFDEKIKKGETLTPAQEKLRGEWKARITELSIENAQYAHELSELSKPAFPPELTARIAQIADVSADVKSLKRTQWQASLHDADVWTEGKRSKSEQGGFKNDLIITYQRQAPNHPGPPFPTPTPAGVDPIKWAAGFAGGQPQLVCMMLNKPLLKHKVIAAHLWKHAAAEKISILDLDETDINDARNGLLLVKSIAEAFDIKHVCFLYNPITQQYTFRVLNPDLLPRLIYTADPKIQGDYNYPDTFASLNHQLLQLPAGVFPYNRVLGWHARCAMKFARTAQWVTDAEYQTFLQQESLVWKANGQPPWYSTGAIDPQDQIV